MQILAPRFVLSSKLGLVVLLAAGLALALGLAAPAQAGGVVGDGTPASCTWAALNTAMTGGGTVTFNCGPAPVTIVLNGSLVVFGGETATVDGGGLITLDGNDNLQIFLVVNGGSLYLRNINLIRGRSFSGGAIGNQPNGTLDLYRVTIEQSVADGSSSGSGGGAIYSQGILRIDQSVLIQNTAFNLANPPRSGGALSIGGGTATVRNTTFMSNTANYGGAIYVPLGTLNLENVSLIGNTASASLFIDGQGGAIYSFATLHITNTTFARNVADTAGGLYAATFSNNSLVNVTMNANHADTAGGILRAGSTSTTLKNTIVANSRDRNDTSDSLECDGPSITSLGNNIISDGSCFAGLPSDQKNTDPLLGPLADNGGPTLTFVPQAGSPAINTGSNTGCPATDQRGASRPFGPACDVGAVEYGANPPSLWLPVVTRS
jgi:predicted outer membrane repeat protein